MIKIRVAVIGGGAAGLCALRHLTSRPELYEATGFEQLSGEGGTWRYTDTIGKYDNGMPVQSSMYKNLRTNLPKEVMAFPGFPFPSNLPSFIRHEDVLQYLKDYSKYYNLQKSIKFDTKVERVSPVETGSKLEWKIVYSSTESTETELFDAVFVCNGHYAIPLVPKLEGAEEFGGIITHSHDYRVPDPYKDKTVVCLGAAASGQDVSLDIASKAKKVIISHNKPRLQTPLPGNMCQQPGIERLTSDSVIFKNGIEEKIDVIMLCTGYRYWFPFLDKVCEVHIEDERVTPLYKHIIHAKFPSLAFIGICKTICPFPQFENQVKFFISTLDGSQKLPSEDEMMSDIEEDLRKRLEEGMPVRYAHTMGPRQWAYNDSLAEMGKFEPIPKAVQILYDEVHRMRIKNLPNYKQKQYRLTGDTSFEEIVES
ncbi:uncharacterized protein LOC123549080 isoform X1 [Mercenaria mercenaria]|uniref:uncharacterized protein LOC123549080 isoform X1 n=2 Tax=Mercenaria mercenaria TaxID=6596 RepID=UPI00234F10EC|nr:uncharacterized protein LOC123549080 isoform X1 [Mercenaria mercenaria]